MPEITSVTNTLIASFLILTTSFVGVIFAWRGLRQFFERNLPYLVSFSAGVFVVVVASLVREMNEIEPSGLLISGTIIFGVLGVHIITRLFPGSHHHEDADCEHEHSYINVRNMFFGDSLHSLADGILLAPAFIISPALGISASLGIAFHEIVQELSEFFVYKKSGFGTKKALLWSFASSLTIILGAFIGLYLANIRALVVPILGVATGSFLYLIVTDLIPESYHQARTQSKYRRHILSAFLGIVLMWIII